MFQDKEEVAEDTIKQTIASRLPDELANTELVGEQLEALIRLDYVWNHPHKELFEPGVPSLMTHVLSRQHEHMQAPSPALSPAPARSNQASSPSKKWYSEMCAKG